MLRLALRTSTSRRFAAAAAAGAALAAVATPKAQARASKAPLRTRTEEASPAATAAPAAAAAAAPLTVTLARDGEALPPDVVASWDQRYEASFRDTGWLCFRVLQTVLTTAVPVGSLITLAYDGGVGAAAYGMIAVWAMARDKYWHEMLPGPLMERQGSPLPDRAVAEEHQVTLNGQTEGMAIVGIQMVHCDGTRVRKLDCWVEHAVLWLGGSTVAPMSYIYGGLWSPHRQALHSWFTDTHYVHARKE